MSYDFVVFGLLVILLLARHFGWLGVDKFPASIGGVLPLIVPWAGAFGGVTISMVDVARHWGDLEANATTRVRWNAWHLTHPFVGAVMGSFAVLIVVLFIGTLGNTASGQGIDLTLSPIEVATLSVVAFVIGYRDRVFQDLVKRVADVIIGAGNPETEDQPDVPAATPEAARAVAEAKAAEALRTAEEAQTLAGAAQKAEARAEELTKARQGARLTRSRTSSEPSSRLRWRAKHLPPH